MEKALLEKYFCKIKLILQYLGWHGCRIIMKRGKKHALSAEFENAKNGLDLVVDMLE